MLSAALAAAFLCAVSDATRTLGKKERSTAFLSAGVSVKAQQTSQVSRKELGMLQKTESQMSSDINQVQEVLRVALMDLGHYVQNEPANTTKHSNPTVSSSDETSKKVHASSPEPNPKQVTSSPKELTSKKVNVSVNNSSRIPSTEKSAKKDDSVKPVMNKSSHVAAASDLKVKKVKQVAQKQEAILETLFKHLKSNIVNLNKQESSAKEVAAKSIQRLQARLKADKAELQKKGLSAFEHERLVNRTRTDTFELQYWTRDRSLGHQMFHTNLKLQHGLMSRVHEVIAACKEAASKGRVDPEVMKKLHTQALPKAFVEMQSTLKHKAQQYYAHVLTARWMVAEEPESE